MAVRTVINNGNSNNRIDIVILGDGYTSGELATTFANHASALIDYLFAGTGMTEPFGRYRKYFNIHLVDVASNESGADIAPQGVFKDTALNSKYYWDGTTERLLYIDDIYANRVISTALSGTHIDPEMKFVTVNSSKYGGGGGSFTTYAGGNPSSFEIALHELGHSFASLSDEYGGNPATYTGGEPYGINTSKDSSGKKWSQWLGYTESSIGTIGSYEGGNYFDKGVYRPSDNSKMRSLGRPFDAISREAFILEFYNYVNPIDSYSFSTNTGPLKNITSLSVDTIDSDTILVDWYVDGKKIVMGKDDVTISELGLTLGTHDVSAKAYDPTDWVRLDRSSLEQTVSWTVELSTQTSTSGNGTLTSTRGNDIFNGGTGTDTANFGGRVSTYTITKTGSTYTVRDNTGNDGTDTLLNIERLQFADKTVNLTIQALAAATSPIDVQHIEELYVAFFNRVPDADGLSYWINQMSAGQTINQIADAFYDAGIQYSSVTGFSAGMSNADFVNVVYRNTLGRSEGADADGLAYWTAKLASGEATHGTLVAKILSDAHAFKGDSTWGWVPDLLDNKLAVANTFAVTLGLNYNTPEASISNGMAIAAAVTPTSTDEAIALIGVSPAELILV